MDGILTGTPHPEQGFRSRLWILRLGKRYGDDRLEAARTRAVAFQTFSYRSVESILHRGLDRQPLPPPAPATTTLRQHEYVRGAAYYK